MENTIYIATNKIVRIELGDDFTVRVIDVNNNVINILCDGEDTQYSVAGNLGSHLNADKVLKIDDCSVEILN